MLDVTTPRGLSGGIAIAQSRACSFSHCGTAIDYAIAAITCEIAWTQRWVCQLFLVLYDAVAFL